MSRPENLGFSSARLTCIDRFLKDNYVESGKLPGALIAISRWGQRVHTGAFGLADRERGVPLQEDAIFRIYSMTKPLTSVALMMLVEDGRVSLHDPVDRYIPSWRGLGVFASGEAGEFQTRPATPSMRIIDLLRHTSGLTYGFQERTNVDAAYRRCGIGEIGGDVALDRMVELLAGIPLEFAPGEAWNYSVSTDVLGYIVGLVSGVPFETFLQTRIFEPLGMTDTAFHVPEKKRKRFAACYTIATDGTVVLQDDPQTSSFLAPPRFVSGGGGLVSTAKDYLRFCHMLLNGGTLDGRRILGPKTIALMTMNHLPGGRELVGMSRSLFSEAVHAGAGFGLGFAVVVDRAQTLTPGNSGEYYWGGAASTAFWVDPKDGLAVVFMTQLIPSSTYPIRQQLRWLVYSAMQN